MTDAPPFHYCALLPTGADPTPYRLLTTEGISSAEAGGRTFLQVAPDALHTLIVVDDRGAAERV